MPRPLDILPDREVGTDRGAVRGGLRFGPITARSCCAVIDLSLLSTLLLLGPVPIWPVKPPFVLLRVGLIDLSLLGRS